MQVCGGELGKRYEQSEHYGEKFITFIDLKYSLFCNFFKRFFFNLLFQRFFFTPIIIFSYFFVLVKFCI